MKTKDEDLKKKLSKISEQYEKKIEEIKNGEKAITSEKEKQWE